jgi:hypothetical protein
MSDAIMRKLADALAVNRELDAPETTGTRHTASLKVLEASIMARLTSIVDQRTKVINGAIDILRTQNAGWEAESWASSNLTRVAVRRLPIR